VVLEQLASHLQSRAMVETVHLATDNRGPVDLQPTLARAAGFVFATGTYWDSWGSPLQRFLEQSTPLEAGAVWLGKPAAVVVTMHSVGGKGVLSRLQGVLSTLGLMIPPMTGFAYSLACHLAMSEAYASPALADFWQLDDLPVLAHNLTEAAAGGTDWQSWIVDRRPPERRWI
jgi:multimeric flavodoxin WrbA